MAIPLEKSLCFFDVEVTNNNDSLFVLILQPTLSDKFGRDCCFNFNNNGTVPKTPPANIIPLAVTLLRIFLPILDLYSTL